MRFGNEARVGFVVMLALALALTGYFFLRGVGVGADLYTIRLSGAGAIDKGNDVLLQGIKVGVVREVGLDAETQKPLVTIAVQKSKPPFKLLKSYRYAVQPSGIIGENYVDIRGDYKPGDPVYAANTSERIPGVASPGIAGLTESVTQISGQLSKTLEKVNVTIDRVNKGILSYDNQIKLARTLDSVTKLTASASRAFGPQTQRQLTAALANANRASAEGAIAARNIRLATEGAGSTVSGLSRQANGLANRANGLANQASGILTQANGIFTQGSGILAENRGELKSLLSSFRVTANNAASLTKSLTFLVRDSKITENSQILFGSLRRTAENVEASSASFRKLSDDPEIANSLRVTLAGIRTSTESLSNITRSIEGLVGDQTSQAQLKATLRTFSETAVTLQATTQNLLVVTDGFKNIVGDPQLQSSLKAIPNELLGTLQATRATAERINALLGGRKARQGTDASGTPGAGSSTAAPANIASLDSGLSFTLRHLSDRDARGARTFGDADFRGELFGGPVRVGLANIGEGTDVTLQSGQFIGRNGALRYGVFRSKLGVGLDYQVGRLRFEGNVYDPNRRSYAVYGGYRLAPQVEVLVGAEKSPGVRGGSVGVRLSR